MKSSHCSRDLGTEFMKSRHCSRDLGLGISLTCFQWPPYWRSPQTLCLPAARRVTGQVCLFSTVYVYIACKQVEVKRQKCNKIIDKFESELILCLFQSAIRIHLGILPEPVLETMKWYEPSISLIRSIYTACNCSSAVAIQRSTQIKSVIEVQTKKCSAHISCHDFKSGLTSPDLNRNLWIRVRTWTEMWV